TWVSSTKGPIVFVSGTAAIRGHVTMSPGNTLPQAAVTLENLATLSEVCGLGRDLGADRFASRYFKVYLRQAADLIPVSAILEKSLILPGDRVCYLHADICREPLQVEIEATLM